MMQANAEGPKFPSELSATTGLEEARAKENAAQEEGKGKENAAKEEESETESSMEESLADSDHAICPVPKATNLIDVDKFVSINAPKAVILGGGPGPCLEPIVPNISRSFILFGNRTLLDHQLEALVKVGVRHVVLALSYADYYMQKRIAVYEQKHHVKITL